MLLGDDEDAGRLSCEALEAVPNESAQETIQKVSLPQTNTCVSLLNPINQRAIAE